MVPRPLQITAAGPAFAIIAPTSPPTSAWLLLDGKPSHQVSRFHAIAPASAPNTTTASTRCALTTPLPIVLATCRPNTVKAMKLKNAAHSTATPGESTRVETTVATEFAESCSPFRKSNASARAISATITANGMPGQTCSMTMPSTTSLTSSQRSTTSSIRS